MINIFSLRTPTHAGSRGIPARLLAPIALLLCLAAQSASAQWHVVDSDANSKLGDIKTSTANTDSNTKDIANYLKITGGEFKAGDRVEDPKQPFNTTLSLTQDDAKCQKLAPAQLTVCKELAETQNAEYMYMVVMYNNSKTRDTVLRSLLTERQGLKETDYGKLEDNTNKLTALYTLIALDQQQLESTTKAYEARIHYLEAQQAQIAQAAMAGDKAPSSDTSGDISIGGVDFGSLTSIGASLASGAALKVALDVAKSPTPSGMQTLGITSSNGF
jgi:hypothetical protein